MASPRARTSPTPGDRITLRQATRTDIPSMSLILAKAFLDFELYDHFLPGRHAHFHQYHRFLTLRLKVIWAEPNTRFYVAERPCSGAALAAGESPTMLGFAAWEANGATHPLAASWRAEKDTWANALERYLVPLEQRYTRYCLNRVADHRTLAHIRALLHGSSDNLDASLHLQFLATDPDHRGIGAGGMLLEQGLEMARQGGLPVVLESSLAGWKFYEYKGFKVCRWVTISRIEGGLGPGVQYDMPMMLWEPADKEGTWLEEDGQGGWRLKVGMKVGVKVGMKAGVKVDVEGVSV